MNLIFEAVSASEAIHSLNIDNVNIQNIGAYAIRDVIKSNVSLKSLTLKEASIDDFQLEVLSEGILESVCLQYVDLRQNDFEELGLKKLFEALQKHMVIKQLYIDHQQLTNDDADQIAKFFSNSRCKLFDLALTEFEMSEQAMETILQALKNVKTLRTLNLNKDVLTHQNVLSIERLVHMHPNFQALCISRTMLCSDSFKLLMQGLCTSQLRYLNISQNNLDSSVIEFLTSFISANQFLEKLLIQHNNFDSNSLNMLGNAIKRHSGLRYLDVSANKMGDQGLKSLLTPIIEGKAILHTFQCRKNHIQGLNNIIVNFLSQLRLSIVNFEQNEIDNDAAKHILNLIRKQHYIEHLDLRENYLIQHSIMEEINDECRQNLFIKEIILPKLQAASLTGFKSNKLLGKNYFRNYDCSHLRIEDQCFDSVDFIFKFIDMNKEDFKSLILKNIQRTSHTHNTPWITVHYFFREKPMKLQELYLEKFYLHEDDLGNLIISLKDFPSLKKIGLVQMEGMSKKLEKLQKSIENHESITHVDLRRNDLKHIAPLCKLIESNLKLVHLNIQQNLIDDKGINQLVKSLKHNIQLSELLYDHDFKLIDIGTYDVLLHELKINNDITNQISPLVKNAGTKKGVKFFSIDLSDVKSFNIDAVIKFISLRKTRELSLKNTSITTAQIKKLVMIVQHQSEKSLEKLNLSNNSQIDDAYIECILSILDANVQLRMLDLSYTMITEDGLIKILETSKENLYFTRLNVENCKIKLPSFQKCGTLINLLKKNCMLAELNLEKNDINYSGRYAIDEQLSYNKQIKRYLFPIIQNQKAFKKKAEGKQIEIEKMYDDKTKPRGEVTEASQTLGTNFLGKGLQKKGILQRLQTATRTFNERKKDERQKRRSLMIDFTKTLESESQKSGGESEQRPASQRGSIVIRPSLFQANLIEKKKLLGTTNSTNSQLAIIEKPEEEQKESVKESECASNYARSAFADSTLLLQIPLPKAGLTDIKFLLKFISQFPNIREIDLSYNNIDQGDMKSLADVLQQNKFITEVIFKGCKTKRLIKDQIINEMVKNKQIMKVFQNELVEMELTRKEGKQDLTELNLSNKKISNLDFLAKLCQGYTSLEHINLSNNKLTQTNVVQLGETLKKFRTIRSLDLSNNQIGQLGLQELCSILVGTKKDPIQLQKLDITENNIPDGDLKVLLALLQQNKYLLDIKYTVTTEKNKSKLMQFEQLKQKPIDQIEDQLLTHHEVSYKLWEKIVFPVYLWKSLIHAKHEAFRFKYVTSKLLELEQGIMKPISVIIYLNALIYYMILFFFPLFFSKPCGEGFDIRAHFIYAAYSIANIIFEITVCLIVRNKLNCKEEKIILFNRWHCIELIFGQIARFDTYLDVAFLSLLMQCQEMELVVPVAIFIALSIIYPVYIFVKMLTYVPTLQHTMPNIERVTHICFIRENMLMATVLDSLCINNYESFCGFRVVFGKFVGTLSFFLQDFPQTTIHLVFLFFIQNDVPHADTTVKMSLVVSSMAICISFFNFTMFQPNDFNPILLQIELKRRQENIDKAEPQMYKKVKSTFFRRSASFLANTKNLLQGRRSAIQQLTKNEGDNETKIQNLQIPEELFNRNFNGNTYEMSKSESSSMISKDSFEQQQALVQGHGSLQTNKQKQNRLKQIRFAEIEQLAKPRSRSNSNTDQLLRGHDQHKNELTELSHATIGTEHADLVPLQLPNQHDIVQDDKNRFRLTRSATSFTKQKPQLKVKMNQNSDECNENRV